MNGKTRVITLMLIDICLINISAVFAYLIKADTGLCNLIPAFFNDMGLLVIINLAIKFSCFSLCRLYSSMWRFAGIYEMLNVTKAVIFSNSLMIASAFILQARDETGVFFVTLFIDMFMIGGIRFAYRVLRGVAWGGIKHAGNPKRVLIAGSGDAGAIVVKELKSHPELMSIPVAMVDDNRSKLGRKINGVPIIGQTLDIVEIAKKWMINDIIIAMPSIPARTINEVYHECLKTGCRVKILPSFSKFVSGSLIYKRIRDINIEDLLGRDPVMLDIDRVSSYLKGRTVLVTGGGGSIGSELCRQIAVYKPARLIILDNYENTAYYVHNELICRYPDLNLEIVIANIREKDRLSRVFQEHKPDVVFHAAAHKHVPLMETNPCEAVRNNVFGTLNMVECSDTFKVERFVLISTDKAVNPTNIMGATKRIAEMITQAADRNSSTEFVAVRFGNVLDSSGSVVPIFKRQISEGGPVRVTHPEVTRFFMTIPEAVGLVIEAGAMAKGGEIFVLNMGEPVRILDLAKNLIRLSGLEPEVDIKIEFIGLRPGEKLCEEILLNEEGLQSTENEKIYIARPVSIDCEQFKKQLDCLKNIDIGDKSAIFRCIQAMVPAYKGPV